MELPKIQYAGATLYLLACALYLSPLRSAAQSCGGTVQSTTYSTTLSGTGSNSYAVNGLSQYYSPQGYTLLAAVVTSYITVNATLQLVNNNPSEVDFTPGISRTDVVKLNGSTLTGGSSTYSFDFTSLSASGSPDDNVTFGPLNVFNNTRIVYDSVIGSSTKFNSFIGTGNLNLTYNSSTSLTLPINVAPTSTATDNITFAVTYYFCNPVVLSSNILTFTATRENDGTVALNWITTNEEAGRKYFIEVSTNGKDFTDYDSRPSVPAGNDASYLYSYPVDRSATGKLYFRLKQVDPDGTATWSAVRTIDLSANTASGFSIYPNPPTDFINVLFPFSGGSWQVNILTADGRLIQRNFYHNTNASQLNFQHKLATGAYFVRATDMETGKSYVASMLIP
jgi:hypothetical protein